MPPDSVLEAVQASSPVKLGEGGCGKDVLTSSGKGERCQDDAASGRKQGFGLGSSRPPPSSSPPFLFFLRKWFIIVFCSFCFVGFVFVLFCVFVLFLPEERIY